MQSFLEQGLGPAHDAGPLTARLADSSVASETVVHGQSLADLRGISSPRPSRGILSHLLQLCRLSQTSPSDASSSSSSKDHSPSGDPAPPRPCLSCRSRVPSAPVYSESHACRVWLPAAHCRGTVVSCKCRSFVNHSALGYPVALSLGLFGQGSCGRSCPSLWGTSVPSFLMGHLVLWWFRQYRVSAGSVPVSGCLSGDLTFPGEPNTSRPLSLAGRAGTPSRDWLTDLCAGEARGVAPGSPSPRGRRCTPPCARRGACTPERRMGAAAKEMFYLVSFKKGLHLQCSTE